MKAKYLETEKILYLFADQDFDTQKVKNVKKKSIITVKTWRLQRNEILIKWRYSEVWYSDDSQWWDLCISIVFSIESIVIFFL